MSECEKYQNQFTEAYYNELTGTEAEGFEEHIKNCPACAAEYMETRHTLDALRQDYTRPELDEDYWDGYWNTLEQKIETGQVRRIPFGQRLKEFVSGLLPPLPVSYRPALAGAALLVIGIFIGRTFLSGPGGAERPVDSLASLEQARAEQVHARAASYFGKAKLVLLGIVNVDTEAGGPLRASFASQARVSRQLLNESAELRRELGARNDAGLLELVGELETVLMQTANLGDEYRVVDVRMIQLGAERKALLFKIAAGQSMLASYAAGNKVILDPDHESTGNTEGNLL